MRNKIPFAQISKGGSVVPSRACLPSPRGPDDAKTTGADHMPCTQVPYTDLLYASVGLLRSTNRTVSRIRASTGRVPWQPNGWKLKHCVPKRFRRMVGSVVRSTNRLFVPVDTRLRGVGCDYIQGPLDGRVALVTGPRVGRAGRMPRDWLSMAPTSSRSISVGRSPTQFHTLPPLQTI